MAYVRLDDAVIRSRQVAPRRARIGRLALLLLAYAVAAVALVGSAPAEPEAQRGFHLDAALGAARATVRTPGQPERPCVWHPGDALFSCADDAYAFIGPYAGFVAGRAVRCTWLHPLPGGATTLLRWPDLALGDRVEGRVWLMEDVGPGAEVRVQVFAGGQPLGTMTTAESREPGILEAGVPPGPARGELRLELTASDHAWRLACLDLLMTGTRGAPRAATPPRRTPEAP